MIIREDIDTEIRVEDQVQNLPMFQVLRVRVVHIDRLLVTEETQAQLLIRIQNPTATGKSNLNLK